MDSSHSILSPQSPALPLADRIARVQESVAAAARRAGRSPDEVTIVAVCKTAERPAVDEAYRRGLRHFGENRVQEAHAKWPALKERHPDVELHLIGPLQSNKVREAVALLDVIETVDRPKLARALAEEISDRKSVV